MWLNEKQTPRHRDGRPLKPWTLTHSFTAVMGGFVIETGDDYEEPFLSGSPDLTLSAEGALLLIQYGGDLLRNTSRESILDRSKADRLSKLLACLQAGWFILQCIGRTASHLPITLLEINTLVHVCCAIMLYVIWFSKPHKVHEPIALKGPWARPWGALLAMCSSWNGKCGINAEVSQLIFYQRSIEELSPSTPPAETQRPSSEVQVSSDLLTRRKANRSPWIYRQPNSPINNTEYILDSRCLRDSPDNSVLVIEGESLGATGFGPRPYYSPDTQGRRTRVLSVDPISLTRLQLASQCLDKHPEILQRGEDTGTGVYLRDLCIENNYVLPEAPEWTDNSFARRHKIKGKFILCLASGVFGGLHALAWNSLFASSLERALWRLSAVMIASSGVFASLYITVEKLSGTSLRNGPCLSLVSVVFYLYIGARLFLLIECFVSLRSLSPKAYETPNWVQLIPHF